LPRTTATALGFHPTRAEIAIGGELARVFVHDLTSGRTRTLDKGFDKAPEEETTGSFTDEVSYTPDGSHLLVLVGASSEAMDARTGSRLRWPDECPGRPARGIRFEWGRPRNDGACSSYAPATWSRSGRSFLTASVGSVTSLVADWNTRRVLWSTSRYAYQAEFSDDERFLSTSNAVFDAKTGERVPTPRLESAAASLQQLRFGPDKTLYLEADFGRGSEVCTIARDRNVTCHPNRSAGQVFLGKRPLFSLMRTLPGKGLDQVQELRDSEERLIWSGGVGATLAMAPGSDVLALFTTDVQFLDASGKALGTPLAASPYSLLEFDTSGRFLTILGMSKNEPQVRLIDVRDKRELLEKSVESPKTSWPVQVAAGGARVFVAGKDDVRGIDVKTGDIVTSIHVEDLQLFAASETEPRVLVAKTLTDPKTNEQTSKIQVFDVSAQTARELYEVTLPKVTQCAWIPERDAWLALAEGGLQFVSFEKQKPRVARVEVFPTGVLVRGHDDTVELGPGASRWVMCVSGDHALPAEACTDRFVPLDSNAQRALW
jgi:hypothetical protein